MNDYLEAFVREGKEHVTNLNNALLELESDPSDGAAMDNIFRTAHTLKGNFAAMGFGEASELAHAVEDVLEAMRRGDLAVTGDRMDRVFEGVDAIEACLDDIEATGEVNRDVSDTAAAVRAVLDEADSERDDARGEIGNNRAESGNNRAEAAESEDLDDRAGERTGDTIDFDADAADGEGDELSAQSTETEIQSVRVDVDRLDELHGLVEQLVTTRIKLRREMADGDRDVEDELDELDKISSSLEDTVMDIRLVPMRKIAGKFPRLVRDLAREQGKEIEFVVEGDDVELDRTILTEISDPLMHLLRNAVDHGIEPPEAREANGKDPEGTVALSAERHRDQVVIEVRDDGRGIDRDRVRQKAVEEGIKSETELAGLSDEAIEDLVFHPGFSTNDEVTDVSGRGVGMDVVRDTVNRLDGSVSVSSEPGEGTTFTMTLPVTVAIVQVLFVESGDEEYGIPVKTIDEISRLQQVEHVDGEEVVTDDETVYPLVRLGEALNVPGETADNDGMLVRIRKSERPVAVHCDDVRGQEEVVVKPFEGVLSGIPGLSGTAVLGEGDVVPILDVSTL